MGSGCCKSGDDISRKEHISPRGKKYEKSRKPTQQQHTEEIRRLETGLQKRTYDCPQLERELGELKQRYNEQNSRLKESERKREEIEDKNRKNIHLFEQGKERADGEIRRLKNEQHSIKERFDQERAQLQKNVQTLKEEKDSLLTRLSAVASAKLTDGNAAIADISDENRPTKLAEQYSELYDNEWTDAFEVLTKDHLEKDACDKLAEALCKAYKLCNTKARIELQNATRALKDFYGYDELSTEMLKQMKDTRKRQHTTYGEDLFKSYEKEVQSVFKDKDEMKSVQAYLRKCISICWLMAIQDPQLYIDTDLKRIIGKQHNSELYKFYTKSGKYIEFIVWPALYICEGGPLLMKGTAQTKSENVYDNVRQNGQHSTTQNTNVVEKGRQTVAGDPINKEKHTDTGTSTSNKQGNKASVPNDKEKPSTTGVNDETRQPVTKTASMKYDAYTVKTGEKRPEEDKSETACDSVTTIGNKSVIDVGGNTMKGKTEKLGNWTKKQKQQQQNLQGSMSVDDRHSDAKAFYVVGK